jgi:tetratricopeptide (TPR) repeat protein
MYRSVAVMCLLFPSFVLAAEEEPIERLFQKAQDQLVSGEYLLARDNFGKVWKDFAQTRGELDPHTIDARIFYAQLLTMTGKPGEAMNILGPMSGGNSRSAMLARAAFALALRQAGQLDRAAAMLKDLVRTFPSAQPADIVHLGRMHCELSVCLAYTGKFRDAEANAKEALRLLSIAGNPIPEHRISVNIVLGQIYLLSNRDAEAYETLMKAREQAQVRWSPAHPELGILDGALGVVAYRAGRYEEAERRTRVALTAMEQLLGPDNMEVGLIARHLALTLEKQKRKQESREWKARARRILDRPRVTPQVSAWSWREVK